MLKFNFPLAVKSVLSNCEIPIAIIPGKSKPRGIIAELYLAVKKNGNRNPAPRPMSIAAKPKTSVITRHNLAVTKELFEPEAADETVGNRMVLLAEDIIQSCSPISLATE